MIKHCIVGLALGMALAECSVAWAATPSSANYALPSSTINSGVGDMSSANYKTSSSLGDLTWTPLSSAGFRLAPGFRNTVLGTLPLPTCRLDVDGSGTTQAFVDGILIVRNLLGISGANLPAGLTIPGPTNTAGSWCPRC